MKRLIQITSSILTVIAICVSTTHSSAQEQAANGWVPLITGGNGEVSVTCVPTADRQFNKLLFHHSYPGFTSIELVIRQTTPDGSQELHTYKAQGLQKRMYSHADNFIPAHLNANTIETITVQYIAYGVFYRLYLNSKTGSRELMVDGKPHNYGGYAYRSDLKSIPMPESNYLPIPEPKSQPLAYLISRLLSQAMMP